MTIIVSFNGRIVPVIDAVVSGISSAALFGRGIFTTITIRDGQPFLWDRHWERLTDNAALAGIDISGFSEQTVVSALVELTAGNGIPNGLARVTFFDGSGGSIWPLMTSQKTDLLITTRTNREVPENLRLAVSPYRVNSTSPLAGVKSCNYLENLLALEEARGRGFDEAVRLNERGEVASACMANVFWRKDGQLYTPSLKSGCLAGTTRGDVIEKQGVVEMDARVEVLQDADEIFLTSAGLGKARVADFDGRILLG
jgi:branched-subunit amino acid aminotransferase/4-amino-4-deoxychorismate lyase